MIFQLIDDHSCLAAASHVAWGETAEAAIDVFDKAVAAHGVPQRLLSDNGIALNPSRRGYLGQLVENAWRLGVEPITGKPYKPTTQGSPDGSRASRPGGDPESRGASSQTREALLCPGGRQTLPARATAD